MQAEKNWNWSGNGLALIKQHSFGPKNKHQQNQPKKDLPTIKVFWPRASATAKRPDNLLDRNRLLKEVVVFSFGFCIWIFHWSFFNWCTSKKMNLATSVVILKICDVSQRFQAAARIHSCVGRDVIKKITLPLEWFTSRVKPTSRVFISTVQISTWWWCSSSEKESFLRWWCQCAGCD